MSRSLFIFILAVDLVLCPLISYISFMKEKILNTAHAWQIVGGLSKPGKMPGWSIGIPAKECNTGGKLQDKEGSVCNDCYALKGCYVFKIVQDAQYRRLKAIKDPRWVDAMTMQLIQKSLIFFVGMIQVTSRTWNTFKKFMPSVD